MARSGSYIGYNPKGVTESAQFQYKTKSGMWSLQDTKNYSIQTTSLTFLTSANAQSTSITIPSTAAAGDIAVYFHSSYNASTTVPVTEVAPTGFTRITGSDVVVSTNYLHADMYYKILVDGDAGTAVTGTAGTIPRKTIAIFRPDFPAFRATLSSVAADASAGGNPAARTLSFSSAGAPQLGLLMIQSDASTPNFTQTPSSSMTSITTSNTIQYAGYKINNTIGSDVTIDPTTNSRNTLYGIITVQ